MMDYLTENSIEEGLKKILAKELKIEVEDITDDSHIVDDIGVESAEMINLLYNIETEFDIEISNEEAGKNLILKNMANLVKEKINMKSTK
jgi:acyl carrier protein